MIFLGIWQFSDQCNAKVLQEESLQYALKEFTSVVRHQEFLEMTPDNLSYYLSHKDLHIESEEDIVDAFLKWLEYLPDTRKKHVDIVQKLNVLSQKPRIIKQKLLDNDIIKSNHEIWSYLNGIFNHLLFSEPLPEGVTLTPLKNNSQFVTSCVILGGYFDQRRSKQCHIAHYLEDAKSVSTSAICKIPSQYNIEMASCVLNDVIYISGCGEDSDEIWKLDMNRALWTQCCHMLEGRICHAMIPGPANDGCIYIIGGYNHSDDVVLGSVSLYDTAKNDTSYFGQLIKPTACCTAQFYDGMIYTFGGVTREDRPSPWIQVINIDTNTCTLLPIKLPIATNRLRSVLCVDRIIALGNNNSFIINIKNLHQTFVKLKHTTGSQSILDDGNFSEIIQVREGLDHDLFGLELLGDKLVKMGGRRREDDSDLTDTIEMMTVYDYLDSRDVVRWEYIGKLPCPMAVYMTGVVCMKRNAIYNQSFTAL